MNWWYLSSLKMTVCVATDSNDIVIRTPHIVHKFYGQPLANLIHWMRRQGKFSIEQITEREAQCIDANSAEKG